MFLWFIEYIYVCIYESSPGIVTHVVVVSAHIFVLYSLGD